MQELKKQDVDVEMAGFFRRMADNCPEIVYSVSVGSLVEMRFISASVQRLCGYSVEEILSDGTGWLDIVHPEDLSRYLAAFEACRVSGDPIDIEYRIIDKNDKDHEVYDRGVAVLDDDGQVVAVDGLIIDATDVQRAKRELERTEVLQNLGMLGAGIAHEINTPIQFIGDNLHFLNDSFKDVFTLVEVYDKMLGQGQADSNEQIGRARKDADLDFIVDEIPQAIEQSLEGVGRVLTMVSAIREFSHIDDRRVAMADINKALTSTIAISRNEVKYVADLTTDLDEHLPMVMCCVDDMNQVFLNLIINAAHSITDVVEGTNNRGLITIKSAIVDRDVLITISDTGKGISADIQEKIFEPFFTTKGSKGTGQGLPYVRSIVVEKHKGILELDSEEGNGTTFTIRLPLDVDLNGDGND